MVSSLRHTVFKNFGKIDYLHYFRRMIKDYETKKWDFDIRTIVKNVKVEIPCPKYICKRGFSKRLCLTILDDNLFLKKFDRYLNGYIKPMQELKNNRILARRIFVAKYEYFPKYNQDCSLVNYDCSKCSSRCECDLSKKLSKKDDHVYKLTRLAEILYGNLNKGHWASLVENTQNIASALRNAILNLGRIPKFVYLDNGKAFRGKYFLGSADFNEVGLKGIYEKLGITTVFANPLPDIRDELEREKAESLIILLVFTQRTNSVPVTNFVNFCKEFSKL